MNQDGGELQIEIKAHNIDAFLKDLLFEFIGEHSPMHVAVNGIRVLDKLKTGFQPHLRCDIWYASTLLPDMK